MIKFSTETIRKNSKILRSLIDKDDLYSSNFYLNFEDKIIQFKSGITKDGQTFFGHLKVDFEVEKDHPNFNVDAFTFLHVCDTYQNLIIENFVFHNGSEKAKLKILNEIEHNEPVDFEGCNWDNSTSLSFDSLHKFDKASKFIGEKFPSINIDSVGEDSYVAASDLVIYFESKLEEKMDAIQFSEKVIRLFADANNQEIRYKLNNKSFYINLDNTLEMIGNLPMFNVLPFTNDGFRERFAVNKLFSFNRKTFSDIIKFFKPFFNESLQKIVEFSFKSKNFVLRPVLEDYEVDRNIKIEYPEFLEGKIFNLSLDYVEKVLSAMESEEIDFYGAEDIGDEKKDYCIFSNAGDIEEKILCKFILL